MRPLLIAIGTLLSSLNAAGAQAQPAPAPKALSDSAISAQFRCPESFATPDSAQRATLEFVRWAQNRQPAMTIAEFVEFRYGLLVKHNCTETLRNLRRNSGRDPEATLSLRQRNEAERGVRAIGIGAGQKPGFPRIHSNWARAGGLPGRTRLIASS